MRAWGGSEEGLCEHQRNAAEEDREQPTIQASTALRHRSQTPFASGQRPFAPIHQPQRCPTSEDKLNWSLHSSPLLCQSALRASGDELGLRKVSQRLKRMRSEGMHVAAYARGWQLEASVCCSLRRVGATGELPRCRRSAHCVSASAASSTRAQVAASPRSTAGTSPRCIHQRTAALTVMDVDAVAKKVRSQAVRRQMEWRWLCSAAPHHDPAPDHKRCATPFSVLIAACRLVLQPCALGDKRQRQRTGGSL